ncbi:MAG TPA: hypothetical protein VFK56_06200 [Mycobacterium sp.]|nr:hypothetical protein [Mycobacterium sp.]
MGLSGPVPARVPAEVTEAVLKTVDDAVAAGFAHTWACWLGQVFDCRVHRWRARRRVSGTLVDQAPGGHPVHTVLSDEVAAILQRVERWDRWTAPIASRPTAAPTSSWCGCRRPRSPRARRARAEPARTTAPLPQREAAEAAEVADPGAARVPRLAR